MADNSKGQVDWLIRAGLDLSAIRSGIAEAEKLLANMGTVAGQAAKAAGQKAAAEVIAAGKEAAATTKQLQQEAQQAAKGTMAAAQKAASTTAQAAKKVSAEALDALDEVDGQSQVLIAKLEATLRKIEERRKVAVRAARNPQGDERHDSRANELRAERDAQRQSANAYADLLAEKDRLDHEYVERAEQSRAAHIAAERRFNTELLRERSRTGKGLGELGDLSPDLKRSMVARRQAALAQAAAETDELAQLKIRKQAEVALIKEVHAAYVQAGKSRQEIQAGLRPLQERAQLYDAGIKAIQQERRQKAPLTPEQVQARETALLEHRQDVIHENMQLARQAAEQEVNQHARTMARIKAEEDALKALQRARAAYLAQEQKMPAGAGDQVRADQEVEHGYLRDLRQQRAAAAGALGGAIPQLGENPEALAKAIRVRREQARQMAAGESDALAKLRVLKRAEIALIREVHAAYKAAGASREEMREALAPLQRRAQRYDAQAKKIQEERRQKAPQTPEQVQAREGARLQRRAAIIEQNRQLAVRAAEQEANAHEQNLARIKAEEAALNALQRARAEYLAQADRLPPSEAEKVRAEAAEAIEQLKRLSKQRVEAEAAVGQVRRAGNLPDEVQKAVNLRREQAKRLSEAETDDIKKLNVLRRAELDLIREIDRALTRAGKSQEEIAEAVRPFQEQAQRYLQQQEALRAQARAGRLPNTASPQDKQAELEHRLQGIEARAMARVATVEPGSKKAYEHELKAQAEALEAINVAHKRGIITEQQRDQQSAKYMKRIAELRKELLRLEQAQHQVNSTTRMMVKGGKLDVLRHYWGSVLKEVWGTHDGISRISKKVAIWTASTGIVFGLMHGIRNAFMAIAKVDMGEAKLAKLYRVTGGGSPLENMRQASEAAHQLTQAAVDLGAQYGILVTDVQDEMAGFVRQGYKVHDVVALTTNALRLQRATDLDAAEARDFLTSHMRQYNLTVAEVAIQVDSLNQLENTMAAKAKEIANGVSLTATTFRQAGIEIEETNALIAATIEATQRSGAEVGRGLRTAVTNLFSDKGKKILRETAQIDIQFDKGKLKDGFSILNELAAKWEYLTDVERENIAQAVAGKRQKNLFLAALANYPRVLQGIAEQYRGMNSAALEVARTEETILGKTDILRSKWQALLVDSRMQGGLTNNIKDFLDGLIEAIERLDRTDPAVLRRWVLGLTEVFALFTGARAGHRLVVGLGALATAFGKVGLAASAASLGPWGAAIGAVVAGLLTLLGHNALFGKNLRDSTAEIDQQARKLAELNQETVELADHVGTHEALARAAHFASLQLDALSKSSLSANAKEAKRGEILKELHGYVERLGEAETKRTGMATEATTIRLGLLQSEKGGVALLTQEVNNLSKAEVERAKKLRAIMLQSTEASLAQARLQAKTLGGQLYSAQTKLVAARERLAKSTRQHPGMKAPGTDLMIAGGYGYSTGETARSPATTNQEIEALDREVIALRAALAEANLRTELTEQQKAALQRIDYSVDLTKPGSGVKPDPNAGKQPKKPREPQTSIPRVEVKVLEGGRFVQGQRPSDAALTAEMLVAAVLWAGGRTQQALPQLNPKTYQQIFPWLTAPGYLDPKKPPPGLVGDYYRSMAAVKAIERQLEQQKQRVYLPPSSGLRPADISDGEFPAVAFTPAGVPEDNRAVQALELKLRAATERANALAEKIKSDPAADKRYRDYSAALQAQGELMQDWLPLAQLQLTDEAGQTLAWGKDALKRILAQGGMTGVAIDPEEVVRRIGELMQFHERALELTREVSEFSASLRLPEFTDSWLSQKGQQQRELQQKIDELKQQGGGLKAIDALLAQWDNVTTSLGGINEVVGQLVQEGGLVDLSERLTALDGALTSGDEFGPYLNHEVIAHRGAPALRNVLRSLLAQAANLGGLDIDGTIRWPAVDLQRVAELAGEVEGEELTKLVAALRQYVYKGHVLKAAGSLVTMAGSPAGAGASNLTGGAIELHEALQPWRDAQLEAYQQAEQAADDAIAAVFERRYEAWQKRLEAVHEDDLAGRWEALSAWDENLYSWSQTDLPQKTKDKLAEWQADSREALNEALDALFERDMDVFFERAQDRSEQFRHARELAAQRPDAERAYLELENLRAEQAHNDGLLAFYAAKQAELAGRPDTQETFRARERVAEAKGELERRQELIAAELEKNIEQVSAALGDYAGLSDGALRFGAADDLRSLRDELDKLRTRKTRLGESDLQQSLTELDDELAEIRADLVRQIDLYAATLRAAGQPAAAIEVKRSAAVAAVEAYLKDRGEATRALRIAELSRKLEEDVAESGRRVAEQYRQSGLLGRADTGYLMAEPGGWAAEQEQVVADALVRIDELRRRQQDEIGGVAADQVGKLTEYYAHLEEDIWAETNLRIVQAYKDRFLQIRSLYKDFVAEVLGDLSNLGGAFKALADNIIRDAIERMVESWSPLQRLTGGAANAQTQALYGAVPTADGRLTLVPLAALGAGVAAGAAVAAGRAGMAIETPVAVDPQQFSSTPARQLPVAPPAVTRAAPPAGQPRRQLPVLGGDYTLSQALAFGGMAYNAATSGNPLMSLLSGGIQGLAVGGPLGAAVGAGVGLFGSLLGGLFGRRKAPPPKPAPPVELPTTADLRSVAPFLLPRSAYLGGRAGGFGAAVADNRTIYDFRNATFNFPGVTNAAEAAAVRAEILAAPSNQATNLHQARRSVPVSRAVR